MRGAAGGPARRAGRAGGGGDRLLVGRRSGRGRAVRVAPTGAGTPVPDAQEKLAALEQRFGGRLGVSATDTGNGTTIGHRADERFLMCSTSKLLAAAAILALRTTRPGLLDRRITYDASQLVRNSPVTSQHVGDGLPVSELCRPR